jgi:hypothetical protein
VQSHSCCYSSPSDSLLLPSLLLPSLLLPSLFESLSMAMVMAAE